MASVKKPERQRVAFVEEAEGQTVVSVEEPADNVADRIIVGKGLLLRGRFTMKAK